MNDNYEMQPGGVPAGTYPVAEFVGTEDFTNQFGQAVKLRFRIHGGQYDGQEATRICSPKLTPGSALGKLAVQLKGSSIAIGESFSFGQYVGTRGSLVVEPTHGGGGRVAMFVRQAVTAPVAPAPPPPPPPPTPPVSPQVTPEQQAAWTAFLAQQQADSQRQAVERF